MNTKRRNKKKDITKNIRSEAANTMISVIPNEGSHVSPDPNYANSLKFSERKDRFLIAITVIAALMALLKISFQSLVLVFDEIYVSKKTIFGKLNGSLSVEHFLFLFFTTTALMIVYKFVKYCYYEAKNFINKKVNIEMEMKADKCYEEVFSTLIRCLSITSISLMFCVSVFADSFALFILMCLLGIVAVAVFAYWVWKDKKDLKKVLFEKIMPFFIDLIVYILVGLFLFAVFLMSAYDTICNGDFSFVNEKVNITFEGRNEPEDINIKVINSKGESEKKLNIQTDFMKSFVELTSYDTDYSQKNSSEKEEKTTIGNNKYYYIDNIDLSSFYTKGYNVIIITYEVNNKKYKIRNDVLVDDNYSYSQEHLSTR